MGALSVGASADDVKQGTLNLLSYNVSGIPFFGDTQGSQRDLRGFDRMKKIGEVLSTQSGCDLIGTQEDFDLHPALSAAMKDVYPYQTLTSGGLPLGDGLNLFSKFPIYNVERIEWRSSFGVLSGSADRLAKKGILHSTVEISEGVFIDFYVIHTDAGVDPKSVEARGDNFRQLAEVINARTEDRAAIVIGDYNSRYDRNQSDDLYNNLVAPAGLTDAWAVLYNNGDCTFDNGENWNPTLGETIDKVMFKSGGGVELTAQSLEYVRFTNDAGQTYTDHISTKASLSYRVTGATTTPSVLANQAPIDPSKRLTDELKAIANAIKLIFTSFDEIPYLIQQGINTLKK